MLYKFKSKRLSVGNGKVSLKAPDYSNIIMLNNIPFTLVGYLNRLNSDIDYMLEEVTVSRLKKDKYLLDSYESLPQSIKVNVKLKNI